MDNNLSKDIILKICTMLDLANILKMRLLSKHYNRIIFDHVKKKYNFKLVKIIAWIFDCYTQPIIDEDSLTARNEVIKNKLQLIENISIDDICVYDVINICKILVQVKKITINTHQKKCDFLLLFDQLENIVIDNTQIDENQFPLLKTIKYLTIKYVTTWGMNIWVSFSSILKKFPNVEKLTSDCILFDTEKIYKIKSFRITSYDSTYNEVIFEDLEEIIIDNLPCWSYSNGLNLPQLKLPQLKLPQLKKININMHNSVFLREKLSKIIFDTKKIEYLEIKDSLVAKVFVSMYSSHEFKSLKKIELGKKYILSNNKILSSK